MFITQLCDGHPCAKKIYETSTMMLQSSEHAFYPSPGAIGRTIRLNLCLVIPEADCFKFKVKGRARTQI